MAIVQNTVEPGSMFPESLRFFRPREVILRLSSVDEVDALCGQLDQGQLRDELVRSARIAFEVAPLSERILDEIDAFENEHRPSTDPKD